MPECPVSECPVSECAVSAALAATADTAAGGLAAAQAATATSAPQASIDRDSGRRTGMLGMPPPVRDSGLQDAGRRVPVAVNCRA